MTFKLITRDNCHSYGVSLTSYDESRTPYPCRRTLVGTHPH